jgi:hypothetical protein
MSATVEDLWSKAIGRNYTDPDYYLTNYFDKNINLYIKTNYYNNPENHKAIIAAFKELNELNRNHRSTKYKLFLYSGNINSYEDIDTLDKLNQYLKISSNSSPKYFLVEQPYAEEYMNMSPNNTFYTKPYAVGKKTPEGGATVYKKSTLKKHIHGRERIIYLGKHNKHYVKMGGKFVPVHK